MTTPERPKPTTLHGIDLSKARIVKDPEEIRKILEYEEPAPKPDQPPLPAPPNEGEETASPEIPIELIIGDRAYELLPILEEGESSVEREIVLQRAQALGANAGEEDCLYFLEHQDEIPVSLADQLLFFSQWRSPDDPRNIAFLIWDGDEWCQDWDQDDLQWGAGYRLVRRRT